MRESQIETYLRERVEAIGGLCYKFVSPGRKNVPDRLVLIGEETTIGRTMFVELKAPGKKPTPGQLREHERLRLMGYPVFVIDSKEGVDSFMASL
jgi:hypothetical protein